MSLEAIEAELKKFELDERKRLGLPVETAQHWFDAVPREFTRDQREHTTILVSGLTMAHDLFIQAALRGIGYKVLAMDVPDNDALQYGREYGNRGQCNPTYFTVGNLVKYLDGLRDQGMTKEDIVKNHVFITAGACGPCRFGTYVTEYRKALRDSGFDGFRVLLFQQTGGLKQATGEGVGLEMNPTFFWGVVRAILIGDCLNALGYRIRPYEVVPGSADRALEISEADHRAGVREQHLAAGRAVEGASRARQGQGRPHPSEAARRHHRRVLGDDHRGRRQLRPAALPRGRGRRAGHPARHRLAALHDVAGPVRHGAAREPARRRQGQERARRLEVQPQGRRRAQAHGVAVGRREGAARPVPGVAKAMGLNDYHLPDMQQIAEVSHAFYDNNLRGGEGHMEIGKLIQNVAYSKVNMTLSVKPFGCMPSSSVSDGIQSFITELYPQGIFLPIETNGDGAVNVYSRVQMQLFKAKQLAQKEVDKALADVGMTIEEVRAYLAKHPALMHPFHRSPHKAGCTAADLVYEVGARKNRLGFLKQRVVALVTGKEEKAHEEAHVRLLAIAKSAAARTRKKNSIVTVAPEVDPDDQAAPPIPAGRKSLRVVN